MTTRRPPDEPAFALPAGRMAATMAAASALLGAGWWLVARLAGWGPEVQLAGPAAGAVVAGVGVLGVVAMVPWRPRAASTWIATWLAGTGLRLLLTPAVTFLLYSAASLSAVALTLSVAVTYLAALLAETGVLALHVNRLLDERDAPKRAGAE